MNEQIEKFVIDFLVSKGGQCSEQELREALKSKFGLTDEDISYILGKMLKENRICHFDGEYHLPSSNPVPLPPNQNPSCN